MAKAQALQTEQGNGTGVLSKYLVGQLSPEELDFRIEAITENLQGAQRSLFDLDQIKVPGSAGTVWEVPNGDPTRELSGIMLFLNGTLKQWYKQSFQETGGGTPPDCRSEDGMYGVGSGGIDGKGGLCEVCPYNQFGSGRGGRGKACSDRGAILLLRPGSLMPTAVNVPTMSLKDLKNKLLKMGEEGIRYSRIEVKLTLQKDKSKDGIDYSKIVLTPADKLTPAEVHQLQLYSDKILPLIKLPDRLPPVTRPQGIAQRETRQLSMHPQPTEDINMDDDAREE